MLTTRWFSLAALIVVAVAIVLGIQQTDRGRASSAADAAGAGTVAALPEEAALSSEPTALGARSSEDADIASDSAEPPPVLADPPALSDLDRLEYEQPLIRVVGSNSEPLEFAFQGEAGTLIRIQVDGKAGMDPVASLSGPGGDLLAENDDESSVNRDSLIIVRLPQSGAYVLGVSPFDAASAGEFEVSLEQLDDEPDEGPRSVALGETVAGAFGEPGDRDIVILELESAADIGFILDGATGVDTYIEVFGPDGSFVGFDDDSGHGLDAALTLHLATAGTYRVEVTPVNAKIGAYSLTVVERPPASEVLDAPTAPGLLDFETSRDHPADRAAIAYWSALRDQNASEVFRLAGPEALALWGWDSATDTARDITTLRAIGVTGFPRSTVTLSEGDRARTLVTLVSEEGGAAGTLVVDSLRVDDTWRVDFAQRFFPRSETGYDGPLPIPTAPPPLRMGPASAPPITAVSAVVVDGVSGSVLFARDGNRPLAPASLTKIATAVLAIERGDLAAIHDVTVDSGKMIGSTLMGLRPGDRFSLRDLLYGLMLPSGNDAAIAVGRAISGDDGIFVAELNALLARVGLNDSRLTNPHGLDEAGHRASAHDLAMLARYAMTMPAFREIVSARSWTASGSREIELSNTNKFLTGYPGADGVKTGFTRAARASLVASAERNGHRVFVALLDDSNRDGDAAVLLNWVFANYCWPDGEGLVGSCSVSAE
ncbi:MAG TPA: serine hydrolase [Dehalococcoidia bacterium]|nr:serine hydrolase [Dehalococcoidia bacterium]